MLKLITMKVKDLNKCKLPVIRIDLSLEKYKGMVLFKDKLDRANDMLKTVGLPKSALIYFSGEVANDLPILIHSLFINNNLYLSLTNTGFDSVFVK